MYFGTDNRKKGTVFRVSPKRISAWIKSMELFSGLDENRHFFHTLKDPAVRTFLIDFGGLFESHAFGMKNAINSCKLS
jgi:hypothetical protein